MSSRDHLFRFTPIKPILDSVKPQQELTHITLEKWLCATRICKTRALARQYLDRGRIKNEKGETLSANTLIKIGDRLLIEYGYELRHIQVTSVMKKIAGPEQRPIQLYRDIPAKPVRATQQPTHKAPVAEPYFPSDHVNAKPRSHLQYERERTSGVNFLRRGKVKTK